MLQLTSFLAYGKGEKVPTLAEFEASTKADAEEGEQPA